MKGSKYSILVADNDADDHFLIKDAINQIDPEYKVSSVNDGLQLMDKLLKRNNFKNVEENLPDLIILDLNMPLLDGYGALKQIRTNELLKKIPVYVMSTSRFDYDKTKAIAWGADGFYSKPAKYSDLTDIVKDIIKRVLPVS